ncbi:hypothetical protein RJT34_32922 [Clitoria ternatea]|uniref:Uncharacterized protein n=1 Tax=Clitoria ternatea TaxID=43366 RepID=A0AAN9EWY1_CLITE
MKFSKAPLRRLLPTKLFPPSKKKVSSSSSPLAIISSPNAPLGPSNFLLFNFPFFLHYLNVYLMDEDEPFENRKKMRRTMRKVVLPLVSVNPVTTEESSTESSSNEKLNMIKNEVMI